MNLAINYSPAAAELVQQGSIQLDYFKVPDWPDLIAEARQYSTPAVHFTLQAGSGKLAQTDWALIDRLLAETSTPYVNVHLDPHWRDFPGIPLDTTDPEHRHAVLDILLRDLSAVVARYGPERVIVENVPYRGVHGEYLRPGVEPDTIRQLIAETKCGFLLDIAHARITAHYLGLTDEVYLNQLPTEHVRELHFAGLHFLDDTLQDHLSILPADWKLLDWVLERIRSAEWSRPWMMAYEYGGVGPIFEWRSDPQVIASQVPRLFELVHPI